MSLILFLIFSFVFLGLFFVVAVIKGLASFLFGRSNRTSGNTRRGRSNDYYSKTEKEAPVDSKKIFSKDEGEYVPFEEMKD